MRRVFPGCICCGDIGSPPDWGGLGRSSARGQRLRCRFLIPLDGTLQGCLLRCIAVDDRGDQVFEKLSMLRSVYNTDAAGMSPAQITPR